MNELNFFQVVKNLKDGKLELNDSSITVRALEGEEEETFLAKVKDDMAKMRSHNNHRGKKGRGGGEYIKKLFYFS